MGTLYMLRFGKPDGRVGFLVLGSLDEARAQARERRSGWAWHEIYECRKVAS